MRSPALVAGKLLAFAIFATGAADAAEIRVFASNALKTALEELGPQFEKASEHKLTINFNAAAVLKTEIEKGAPFDLAILGAPAADDLMKQGRLVAATSTNIARSAAGLAVKRGAPKPDISTTEAFKRALLVRNPFAMWNRAQPESTSKAFSSGWASHSSSRRRPSCFRRPIRPRMRWRTARPKSE
jgi:molybdate transport system substrate-binding protein